MIKSVDGLTRLFVYDQAGNLIAEINADTVQPLAEYIWLERLGGKMIKYKNLSKKQKENIDLVFLVTGSWVTAIMGAVLFYVEEYMNSAMMIAVYLFVFLRHSVTGHKSVNPHIKKTAFLSLAAGGAATLILGVAAFRLIS